MSDGVFCFVSGVFVVLNKRSKEGGQAECSKQIRSHEYKNKHGFHHTDAPPVAESAGLHNSVTDSQLRTQNGLGHAFDPRADIKC